MRSNQLFALAVVLVLSGFAFAQRPPRPQGPPRDIGAPRDGRGGRPGEMGPVRPDGPPRGEWIKPHDTNKNGSLDAEEFAAAIERTFTGLDQNANGTIERGERGSIPPNDGTRRPGGEGKAMLPPFFFDELLRTGGTVPRSDFEKAVRLRYSEMDSNHDGILSSDEARPPVPPDRGEGRPPAPRRPGMPPNAEFLGAELRFGDKLVKGQPFSADSMIEDTKRLFDGTTVTKKRNGAIYRDSEGRTRREQPFEVLAGVEVVGNDNKPQMLVFINDLNLKLQIFLDANNKIARKHRIDGRPGPLAPEQDDSGKTESLGTKNIEGVRVEGTRTTMEIPAGQIGNDKPIQVISEKWFSPELQVVVMSRHLDPLAGEHIFRLINIKRTEPAAELFSVPAGYKIEN